MRVVLFFSLLLCSAGVFGQIDKSSAGYRSCPDGRHPHLIDLGLPSGTKWACCNVGASSPEVDGDYYAWGETAAKSVYTWSTYQHCDGSSYNCHNLGESISGTQYDVARVKWGGEWQMPTLDQTKELLDKCKSEWTTQNGVAGRRFMGPNGGSIFMPAAGYRSGSILSSHGSWGDYWSGTQSGGSGHYVSGLDFSSSSVEWYEDGSRRYGFSVRPVAR